MRDDLQLLIDAINDKFVLHHTGNVDAIHIEVEKLISAYWPERDSLVEELKDIELRMLRVEAKLASKVWPMKGDQILIGE